MKELSAEMFQRMLSSAVRCIIQNEPYLTEIDSVIGDGDHGTGMKRGCEAVLYLLSNKQYKYIDDLCYEVSIEFIRSMGGASGVIFGTMFLGGISCLPHEDRAVSGQISSYFMSGEQAIERRGKGKPGQKTMLDALYPACVAMKKAAENSEDIVLLFQEAYKGALQGVEKSKILKSQKGRSKNFGERTIGLPDPGAVSTSLFFKAFYETIKEYL